MNGSGNKEIETFNRMSTRDRIKKMFENEQFKSYYYQQTS